MSFRSVMMSPNSQGYAVFLEEPKTGAAVVSVMTEKYVRMFLHPAMTYLYEKNNMKYPVTNANDLEGIVKAAHDMFIAQGYKDRTAHAIEVVDQLYDFNDKEKDFTKAIIEIKKRYNLHLGGTFLVPTYPEVVPFFGIPLPTSPI
jgi:hypothetical protein